MIAQVHCPPSISPGLSPSHHARIDAPQKQAT